jgi:hypothetical protein
MSFILSPFDIYMMDFVLFLFFYLEYMVLDYISFSVRTKRPKGKPALIISLSVHVLNVLNEMPTLLLETTNRQQRRDLYP